MKFTKTSIPIGFWILLLVQVALYADTLKDISEVEKLTKISMQYIGNDNIARGLDVLAPYSIVSPVQFKTLKKQLIAEFPKFRSHFGSVLGSELVGKTYVGDSMFQITYIQKFEKHILSWSFDYYKPKDTWVLNSFETADGMGVLFKSYGKKFF